MTRKRKAAPVKKDTKHFVIHMRTGTVVFSGPVDECYEFARTNVEVGHDVCVAKPVRLYTRRPQADKILGQPIG